MGIKEQNKKSTKSKRTTKHQLFLHNDNIHSFEEIIEALQKITKHEAIQAEQCALIAHFKETCSIKKGMKEELIALQTEFTGLGIKTSINKN
ncbi:MAG: ATP-dependent Clp protease adaptor ClpS [Bacteroidales bacterium]|nr:ATP-dependent Clp protease adaptor ClpS [Bacteroidales bacterium]